MGARFMIPGHHGPEYRTPSSDEIRNGCPIYCHRMRGAPCWFDRPAGVSTVETEIKQGRAQRASAVLCSVSCHFTWGIVD